MAKQSKRQQRLEKTKAIVVDGATNQSFVIDDLEGMWKQQDKMYKAEFVSWQNNCFKSYAEYWLEQQYQYKHQLTIFGEEFTVFFFTEGNLVNQVQERMDVKLAGVLQIISENKTETCMTAVPYHINCDKDFARRQHDLNDISKVITSIVLNHSQNIQYPEWGTVLPYIFYNDLKLSYMEKCDEIQASNVYSVLD